MTIYQVSGIEGMLRGLDMIKLLVTFLFTYFAYIYNTPWRAESDRDEVDAFVAFVKSHWTPDPTSSGGNRTIAIP